MTDQPTPQHARLDAWHVARELVAECHRVGKAVKRGHAHTLNQLARASEGGLLNIAEGANRRGPRDKARVFDIAAGEAGECDAALEVLVIRGAVTPDGVADAKTLAYRLLCMLPRLSASARARAG